MSHANIVILLGNVGADPDIKYTQTGKLAVRISLATSTYRADGNGGYTE